MAINPVSRAVAVLFGAAVALAAVTSGAVHGHHADLGGRALVVATPTGELGVEPTGTVLDRSLHAGEAATGTVTVRNQTARRLTVRPAAARPAGQSDVVRFTVTPGTFELESGASRSVDVAATVPADAIGAFEGRTANATLTFEVTP